jgi:hypothetical protein
MLLSHVNKEKIPNTPEDSKYHKEILYTMVTWA